MRSESLYSYQTIEEVFRLDISMYDIFRVQVFQSFAHLTDVICCYWFSIPRIWLLLEVLVELATRGVLEYQINLLLVPEETIHAQDVVMTEVGLNLNLSPQLVFDVGFQ